MFPPPPLTVAKVFNEFRTIASLSGKNAQQQKQANILKMFVAASKTEAKYLARALSGKLRIHLADKTVIAALAAAVVLNDEQVETDFLLQADGSKKSKLSNKEEQMEQRVKDATATLSAVYCRLPVWDIIVPKLLQFGDIDERLLEACQLLPGVPVSPMLARPTKAISQVLERFAEASFTCEYKYDGERAQVHRLSDGSVKIYSRNAENLTPKYPDLVQHLPLALKDKYKGCSFIIDSEAVAYDVEKAKILPFQELQSRKRKDVNADDIKVKVCIFAFDLLYFDGDSLIEEPLNKRRSVLTDAFDEQHGRFMFAKGHDSRDPEQIMELLNASVKEGCEGLMVKALDGDNSTYEPANRSQNWLKVKKDYLEGCGDSLDLVPIGGYRGRGKRTGAYGAFLLACYDPDNEEYQSVCKIGTGFSEAQLDEFAKFFNDEQEQRTSEKVKSYYRTPSLAALQPDVWFEPLQVWEVKCADLSISPQHTAGIGRVDADKGVALRFPRFVRVREDKGTEDATTAEQVVEMYLNQSAVADNG
ncbi:DNA Ligase I [Gracilaria domingensis]|nr:DNA Ligase I [Gracilaria domingensis]